MHVPRVPLVQLIQDKFFEAKQPVRCLGQFCSEDPVKPWEDFLRIYLQEIQARQAEWILAPCQVASPVSTIICGENKTISRSLVAETHSCVRGWQESQQLL